MRRFQNRYSFVVVQDSLQTLREDLQKRYVYGFSAHSKINKLRFDGLKLLNVETLLLLEVLLLMILQCKSKLLT